MINSAGRRYRGMTRVEHPQNQESVKVKAIMVFVPEIIPAIPTPFTVMGELDLGALRENLVRLESQVDGIFAAGTTGEFPALSDAEKLCIIDEAIKVFGSSRVIAHVGAPSSRQAATLLHAAKELGATRFAAITPYYLPVSRAGIAKYYENLRRAAGAHSLYAYVFPEVAGTDVAPADLPELIAAGIDGIKVSGLASTRVEEYLANAPTGFSLWSGNDADLPSVLSAGGRGTVSGVAAVLPEPWVAFREAAAVGDECAMAEAQTNISSLVELFGPSIGSLKYALGLRGLTQGCTRMSVDTISAPQTTAIRAAVERFGVASK